MLAALGGAREKDGGRCAGEDEEEEDNAEFVGAAEPFQFVQDLMVVGVGVHAKRNCYECYRLGGGVDERCVSTRAPKFDPFRVEDVLGVKTPPGR